MTEEQYAVRARSPTPSAEGIVRLVLAEVSSDQGTRWVVRVQLDNTLEAALATLAGMAPASRGARTTERLFAGETEAEALIRAQAWVHKHYEVLTERGPEHSLDSARPPGEP